LFGVVFTGGEKAPARLIRRLLEGKKAIIAAADSGLACAEEAGIRPDFIIGDMDSIDVSRLDAYPPQCVMRYEHDKDYTDTELALRTVIEKGCDEIWIIGGGGGRIDHLFALRSLLEREIFPVRWLTDAADIRCIDAETKTRTLCEKLEKGSLVSVFPLGGGEWKAKSEGLKWPLDGLAWDRGFFGISNTAPQGEFSISAEKGRFMVILPLPVFK